MQVLQKVIVMITTISKFYLLRHPWDGAHFGMELILWGIKSFPSFPPLGALSFPSQEEI